MADYNSRFVDRRRGKDRRDWDEFVFQNRRTGTERRSGIERRREQTPFIGLERRKLKTREDFLISRPPSLNKSYYCLNEAADLTETSASDILEWIRCNLIKDSSLKRDYAGRRLFSRSDIEQISLIKRYGAPPKQEFTPMSSNKSTH
ncbi:hypothetical protein JW926_00265 [Candidatus Sumerlaeota bacterium]|nr:hypothetical protein [Candidatus Sumerlaeota bacterium]